MKLPIKTKPRPAPQTFGEELLRAKQGNIRGIFLHIHKCAGTSLMNALQESPQVISCTSRPGNFPLKTGRERIPDTVWQESFKFTFVRNPYDRVLSAYGMFRKFRNFKEIFKEYIDFLEFLRWTNVQEHHVEHEESEEAFTRSLSNVIHHCSSFHNPKYRIDEMDFIGKTELLAEDIATIEQHLDSPLPHVGRLNASGISKDYQSFYGAREKEIIHALYHEDLSRFDYTF